MELKIIGWAIIIFGWAVAIWALPKAMKELFENLFKEVEND